MRIPLFLTRASSTSAHVLSTNLTWDQGSTVVSWTSQMFSLQHVTCQWILHTQVSMTMMITSIICPSHDVGKQGLRQNLFRRQKVSAKTILLTEARMRSCLNRTVMLDTHLPINPALIVLWSSAHIMLWRISSADVASVVDRFRSRVVPDLLGVWRRQANRALLLLATLPFPSASVRLFCSVAVVISFLSNDYNVLVTFSQRVNRCN